MPAGCRSSLIRTSSPNHPAGQRVLAAVIEHRRPVAGNDRGGGAVAGVAQGALLVIDPEKPEYLPEEPWLG